MQQYAGSKRKARRRAREERLSKAFAARLRRIAALASQLDSAEQLDGFLDQIESPEMRAAVRDLVLTLRRPQVAVVTGPEALQHALAHPKRDRTLVFPTEAGPLVVPN